jgi:hypothetical protein
MIPISENVPNAETLASLKENDKVNTDGLKKYDSVKKMFEDLGGCEL